MDLSQIIAQGFHKTFTGSDITITEAKMKACEEFLINGKAVTKRKQATLWGQFVPCDGITNAASTSIDTGVYAQDNIELFCRVKAVSGSFYLLQARETGSATIYGLSGSSGSGSIGAFGMTSDITRTDGHIYTIKATRAITAVTLYVKDETTGQEDTQMGISTTSLPSPTTIKLFGDASKLAAGATVYRAYIKVNGQMAWDMYPCVDVNNSNAPVAYDDVAHAASTVVSGSITAGDLIQPISHADSDGTACADTEIVPKTFDYTITFEGAIKNISGGPNCAWGYMGNNGNLPRWVCAGYTNGYLLNANATTRIDDADTNNHTFVGKVYKKNGSPYWSSEIDGVVKQNDQALASASAWQANTLSIYLFARNNENSAGNFAPATFKKWICEKAGVVIKHYIPVRVGQTVELLDLVNWQFATRTGTFTAGADVPMTELCPDIIETNAGDALYGQYGKNLFDGVMEDGNIGNDGQDSGSNTLYYRAKNYTAVIPGEKYQFSFNTTIDNGQFYIIEYDKDKGFISRTSYNGFVRDGGYPNGYVPSTNVAYIRFFIYNATPPHDVITWAQLEKNATVTPYEPYHFGLHPSGEQKVFMGEQGVVADLSALSWSYSTTLGCGKTFYATLSAKNLNGQVICFCDGYTGITANSAYGAQMNTDKVCWIEDGRSIRFHDDIYNGDTAAFKASLSGKVLFYPRPEDASFIPPQTRTITTFLPSANSFIDAQKATNNVECDWKLLVLTGTERWGYGGNTSGYGFYLTIPNCKTTGKASTDIFCTHLSTRTQGGGYAQNPSIGYFSADDNIITVRDDQFRDVDSVTRWKAHLAEQLTKGDPYIIAYPLATPEVTTVEIAPVSLANGTNRVTASAGTVKVTANVRVI